MIFACVDMTQLHSEFLRNPFKGFAATEVKICPFPLLWQFGYWLFLRFALLFNNLWILLKNLSVILPW